MYVLSDFDAWSPLFDVYDLLSCSNEMILDEILHAKFSLKYSSLIGEQ